MVKTKHGIVALLLVSSPICLAQVEGRSFFQGFEADIGVEDGDYRPRAVIPLNWSQRFTSEFRYEGRNSAEIGLLNDSEESLEAIVSRETRKGYNLLTYRHRLQNWTLSFGIDFEQIDISAKDAGFTYLDKNVEGEQQLNTFYQNRSIEIDRWSLPLTVQHNLAWMRHSLRLVVVPVSDLSLEQDFQLNPAVDAIGTASSTSSQDPAYSIVWEGRLDQGLQLMGIQLLLGWRLDYDFLTTDYESLSLTAPAIDEDGGYQYDYTIIQVNEDRHRLGAEARIYFASQSGFTPYLGYRWEQNREKGKVGQVELDEKSTNTNILFGVESFF